MTEARIPYKKQTIGIEIMTATSRLPALPSLTTKLPHGTESGKEFGRIVNLLLLSDARATGNEFTIFDDASGDFEGLDSFSRMPKARDATGYQYKFYESPLSDDHRHEIVVALENAARRTKTLKLKKWVLVTPNDFLNSGRRKGGGDVEWLENLRGKYEKKFEIEHLGHTKLISLFMQAPYLCLFYYPELVNNGIHRRKSIQQLRELYDRHMKSRHGRIEFVGMSVYKDETSRRVPLENIYIPLSILAERSPEEHDETPRVDPTTLLSPTKKSIILGDPGSGKSTLLAFLALVGISEQLQTRCGRSDDGRLTVVVTLRRYADELKENHNLSLLDYILSVAQADFNIPSLDHSFFEFYLESGQAIMLFDGLDELPGSKYKKTIKERIESFTTSYPNNTVIVTSRLVGYEAEVRFDDSYGHFRVAKLRPREIEKFILDWYAARIDDTVESQRNASDLIRVIKHTDSESIRDLARNPLLLTIVTLVHRIDAVLPDQRVILYQKCTETLLNTWYKAKHRDDEPVKGRVERRNRLRIEAIAYWMQQKSLGEQGRSVAPQQDLRNFLTQYIIDYEHPKETDEPAEDQAEVFLDFIKNAAGLLIEAGDGIYSFIHLTFQEYLCATYLSAFGEMKGAQSIWDEIDGQLQHPRWREVVRLLVASLKSIQGQTFFIDKLLNENEAEPSRDAVLLLVGLLKDAIEPAEDRALKIIRQTIRCLLASEESNDVRVIENALRSWIDKQSENKVTASGVHDDVFATVAREQREVMALIRGGLDLPQLSGEQKSMIPDAMDSPALALLKGVIFEPTWPNRDIRLSESLFTLHMIWSTLNPETNITAVALLATSLLMHSENATKRLFLCELGLLPSAGIGPYQDHGLNLASMVVAGDKNSDPVIARALHHALTHANDSDRKRHESTKKAIQMAYRNRLIRGAADRSIDEGPFEPPSSWTQRARRLKISSRTINLQDNPRRGLDHSELTLIRGSFDGELTHSPDSYWLMFFSSELFTNYYMPAVQACANIQSIAHWTEALRFSLARNLPIAVAPYFDIAEWQRLETALEAQTAQEADYDFAAWLLLFDIWLWNNHGYEEIEQSPFNTISKLVASAPYPAIKIALAARAACFGSPEALVEISRLALERNTDIAKTFSDAGWVHRILSANEKTKKRRKPRG